MGRLVCGRVMSVIRSATSTPIGTHARAMASLASGGLAPVARRLAPRTRAVRRRAACAAAADSERLDLHDDASTHPAPREPTTSSRASQDRNASTNASTTTHAKLGVHKTTDTTTRRAALATLIATAGSFPSTSFAKASPSIDSTAHPRSYFQDVPTLFAPLYGSDERATLLKTVVPEKVFALEQNLALGPLETPLRCVVVKLNDGSLWVHAPLAPTSEFFELVESLGPVKHVVVPTYALEHKIFAKNALERWPDSKLWVAPGQFSFPFEVGFQRVFGRDAPDGVLGVKGKPGDLSGEMKPDATLNNSNPEWLDEIACDVLRAGTFGVLGKTVTLYEATFFVKATKTMIVTDCVAYVPKAIPELQTPEKLLLVGKFSTDDPQPSDTYDNRLAGWKKTCLLVTYFFPEHEELVRPGLVEWSEGWEENFDRLSERLLVPPVVRATLYSQDPKKVREYVDRVSSNWDFETVVPAHWAGPVNATPAQFREAFRFLEDFSIDAFPEGDMKRGLKPIADAVANGKTARRGGALYGS